ncbi:MAG: glutamate-1-semialdehyde 2,1-aminomutase [Thermoproteota archaeon]|nr:glutamate-1-semialdehyde 2,1-aminomutase [Thermoproteota archaeon]
MLKPYMSQTSKSQKLYERAKRVLPAGVSYIIRHFNPYPFYTAKAKGSKLVDEDGNEYIDFWIGHTALILGHSPPPVIEAVKHQIEHGTHYGTSHKLEIALAEQVVKMVPCADMVRFTNSGTEANMYAMRLARTYTGRDTIVKFEGGWHGGYDALHVAVSAPLDVPQSAGLTEGSLKDTIVAPYNDMEGVREKVGNKEIAAVVIEPVLGAGGAIPAEKAFLQELREFCTEQGALLIFDEVITGFRLAPGGGQQFYGVIPDITVLGKILGGGFPVGAFVGRKDIMERVDALTYERPKFSFHGGTFCANPVTMTAGLVTLKILEDGKLINQLNQRGEKIREELRNIFGGENVDVQVTGAGSLFNTHFTKEKVKDVRGVFNADRQRLFDYHIHLIANGVFFLPTKTGALSTVHSDEDIQKFLMEAENYVKSLPTT